LTNPYAEAAEAMRLCIIARANAHRRLVMAICALALASMAAALAAGQPWPLCMLAGLPALVLNHFARDRRKVERWRQGVLAAWALQGLRLDVLASMLRQIPSLPPETVGGLVDCLPNWPGDVVPLEARPALADAQARIGRLAESDLHARAVLAMVAAVLIVFAAVRMDASILLGLCGLPLAWWGWTAGRRHACMRAAQTLHAALATQSAGVDDAARQAWVAGLDLHAPDAVVAFAPAAAGRVEVETKGTSPAAGRG
jgi:hypothetical protein